MMELKYMIPIEYNKLYISNNRRIYNYHYKRNRKGKICWYYTNDFTPISNYFWWNHSQTGSLLHQITVDILELLTQEWQMN